MNAPLPRILLVEPQFVLRRTIAMVARDLGMLDFHEASSVGRARTLLAAEAYAGLVLDLSEGAPALALLQALRQGQLATLPSVWAIALSTSGQAVDTARLQALGVARALDKPVRISDLLDAIAQVQSQGACSAGGRPAHLSQA